VTGPFVRRRSRLRRGGTRRPPPVPPVPEAVQSPMQTLRPESKTRPAGGHGDLQSATRVEARGPSSTGRARATPPPCRREDRYPAGTWPSRPDYAASSGPPSRRTWLAGGHADGAAVAHAHGLDRRVVARTRVCCSTAAMSTSASAPAARPPSSSADPTDPTTLLLDYLVARSAAVGGRRVDPRRGESRAARRGLQFHERSRRLEPKAFQCSRTGRVRPSTG